MYVIDGIGGFSGEIHYFSATGSIIDIFYWNDIVGENEPPEVLFNFEEYECTLLLA